MSQEQVVKNLSLLLRALDGDGLLAGPCNFMSRMVENMLEVARVGTNQVNPNSAFVISEYESDIDEMSKHKSEMKSKFYASRKELISLVLSFVAFLYQYVKIELPKIHKRSFTSKVLSKEGRKNLLQYAWSLCYLDVIHSRFCCYSLNLYITFLHSFDDPASLLEYSKDVISIVAARDKQDLTFKKEVSKLAIKLYKHHLVQHYSSKSSFVVKFTTSVLDEYFNQTPSITNENLMVNFKKMKLISISTSHLNNFYFNYKNAEFLNNIIQNIEEKLINSDSFFTPFNNLYENNKHFQNIVDNQRNKANTSILASYSLNLNITYFKFDKQFLKVYTIEKNDKYQFFKELEYLQNIKDVASKLIFPDNYTSSDFFASTLFVFFSNIQYTLEEVMFDNSMKRRYLFNEYEILVLLYEIVQGVSFLHNNSIPHTDLTLDNIVIVNKKIKLICGNKFSFKNKKLMLQLMLSPSFECKTISYDMFSISMILYILLHSRLEVDDIISDFLEIEDSAVIPSDTQIQEQWIQLIAKGYRPKIEDDHFVVDRPLRIELVTKMNNLWNEQSNKRLEAKILLSELNELINEYLETRHDMVTMLEFIVKSVETKLSENKNLNEEYRKQNLTKNRQSLKKFRSVNNIHSAAKPKVSSELLRKRHLSKDSTSGLKSSAKNIFNFRGRKTRTSTKQMLRPLSHGSEISVLSKASRRYGTQEIGRDSKVSRRDTRSSRKEGTKRENIGRSMLYRIRKKKKDVPEKKKSLPELELDDIQEIVKKSSSEEPYKNLLEEFEQQENERHSRLVRTRNGSDEYLQEVFEDVESETRSHSPPRIVRLGKKKRGSFTKAIFSKKPENGES